MKKIAYLSIGLIILAAITLLSLNNNSAQSEVKSETIMQDTLNITMYRGERCNCCIKWADYLESEGFIVKDEPVENLIDIKVERGVPSNLGSCHTAVIDGYVVEGHVPAKDIRRLVSERPDAIGISVPGMPAESPGMDTPVSQPYAVVLFGKDGMFVYAEYE